MMLRMRSHSCGRFYFISCFGPNYARKNWERTLGRAATARCTYGTCTDAFRATS